MSVKFGILGYGFMGHIHGNTIIKHDGTELIAVCDNDPVKLADVPESAAAYEKMDDLLAIKEIDVVIIAVSNHVHLEAVKKTARAGKHIICEKPAALSVQEFDEMMRIVEECGVKFTVHQQRRWDTDFRTAKAVYDSRSVGDIYTIQSGLYGFNGNMHDWHVYKKYGGGMLYDWGVHLIDQMLWMMGSKVRTVYADIRTVINEEVDDYFKILLKFENGVTGEIELGTYFLTDRRKWFERHWFIGGSRGSMYSDGFDPEGKIVRTSKLLQNVPGKTTMTAAGPTRSFGPPAEGLLQTEPLPEVDVNHGMFFDNFLKALKGEEEFVIKAAEVRRVLALMEAARESAETGRSIDFE